MFYYLVWVRSTQYHGNEALTYESSEKLTTGALVRVPLRTQHVLGFVVATVSRPSFKTKPVVEALDLPPLSKESVRLALWLQAFYPAPIGTITSLFLPENLKPPVGGQAALPSEPIGHISAPLTNDQRRALQTITDPDTYILHGRTGSGKTRIYIELADRTITQGRSVVILSPEIGLTSQLAGSFESQFKNRVVVFHSQLTKTQRQQAWLRLAAVRAPYIVIGPRSVLFSPLSNIGLIVIDEAHDQAYKQEPSPHYQSLRVAAQLRKLHQAMLVLGSATPSITDYYLAQKRQKKIIRLQSLAKPNPFHHQTTIVDLKNRSLFTRTAHLSLPLIEAISRDLERGKQALLYLNRRGTARIAICQACGWEAVCPNCDIPLIYHGDHHALRCHICGYSRPAIISCPSCASASLTFRSFGTKAIVDEVACLFPDARIARFDADNTKQERLENQYQQILDGQIDILVGTQIITKGLDLPGLSTLGVVLADTALYMPDYTANERMYQTITQVIGRVGRGHTDSQTIIQTYHPTSPLLNAALNDDWVAFYDAEIAERKKYSFPPFCHLLQISCARSSSAAAERAAAKIAQGLAVTYGQSLRIEGPAPAFHEKKSSKYIWQLVIKSQTRSVLLSVIAGLPSSGCTFDLDPVSLL